MVWKDRLKMLVAYSTVSQIGFLFLLFPLAVSLGSKVGPATIYHLLSHGTAKAAMFMGAGAMLKCAHSDLIRRTRGTARKAPFAVAAVILSGAALAGVLPGGGAKGKLLQVTFAAGQWWWSAVIVGGMLLAGVYTFIAVRQSFLPAVKEGPGRTVRSLEITALLLAIGAIVLSFNSPAMPVEPEFVDYETTLRSEAGRVLFTWMIGMMPGTASVDLIEGNRITVHVIDQRDYDQADLRSLESKVADVFDSASR